ncbi:type IV toxin-antitoxin system AbiEi family antitoxin domain-containing protein [Gordonia sp. HS-NH1]|uniref:type IV toxin-antitoxin system AbiEi family antitoxin domain-containing protein n=1 Tax=Gordonia sp. HS-NH1 TaxID=1435068 RepID=UPI0009FD5EAA|nr:type IV toxin-antitoxin system AbiEi family antitoxin domain-containing protein [Gordonia sp. HS-NH1]
MTGRTMEPVAVQLRLSSVRLPVELRTLALGHDGVITAADAREHGVDRWAVQRRVRAGEWVAVHPRVYRLADHPETDRTRIRIATLAAGAHGVLSGLAAAWWHGMVDAPPATPTVTALRGRHGNPVTGVRILNRALADADVLSRDGLPVTGIALSALEGAVEGGVEVIDAALQQRRTTVERLVEAYERRRGCIGAADMGPLIALVESGARSAAERLAVTILQDAGLSGWKANHPSCGYEIDLAFDDRMVAVEIDGLAFHRDAATFQRDRSRRNALIAAGWTVLNFTWGDLRDRPEYVVSSVRHALAAAA